MEANAAKIKKQFNWLKFDEKINNLKKQLNDLENQYQTQLEIIIELQLKLEQQVNEVLTTIAQEINYDKLNILNKRCFNISSPNWYCFWWHTKTSNWVN
ncbi:hypothetical protein [Williamsoniiplasma lucivorax]|uniref:Uncharacterized protein n=1 Tax=Williamsoniiplasma lucivorax TaxID=209274 RepID=A0A2S5R9S1_9MOLU|nr:hypothetical protein [Williamsoniiplasma lucivorax]PPE04079.1 hypothetical protein ELUCI_v1c08590 [Williamsoniiplasma lucivorax]